MTATKTETSTKVESLRNITARKRELQRELDKVNSAIAKHPDTIKNAIKGIPFHPLLLRVKAFSKTLTGIRFQFGRTWYTAYPSLTGGEVSIYRDGSENEPVVLLAPVFPVTENPVQTLLDNSRADYEAVALSLLYNAGFIHLSEGKPN